MFVQKESDEKIIHDILPANTITKKEMSVQLDQNVQSWYM
jgi:hypothetical protein